MRNRISEIDGLRGIAATLVMLFHYSFVYNPDWEIGKIFHYGYMGVPMFFIISGFVIYMSVETKKTPLNFCINRFLRLYPVYWVCLIITIVSMFVMNIHLDLLTWKNIAINFTMFQRFIGFKDIDGAYWTLAIELLFYGFVVLILFFKKLEKIIELFLGVIIVLMLVNLILTLKFPEIKNIEQITRQFRYFHLFLAGMIFYKIHKKGIGIYETVLLIICFLLNFQAQIRFNIVYETFIVLVFFIIFLILTSKYNYILNILNNKFLQFLGKISYPLYLLNEMFGISISNFLQLNFNINLPLKILVVITIVILFSTMIHLLIEKPLFKIIKTNKHFK